MRDLESLEFSMCTMATLHCFSTSLTSQKIHWFNHNLPFHLVLHHFLASEYSHGRQHDHAWQGLGMAIVMVTWTPPYSACLCTSCKNPNASGLKASNAVPDSLRESLLLRSKGMLHKWNHSVPWDWATLALLGLKMMPYTLTWRYTNQTQTLTRFIIISLITLSTLQDADSWAKDNIYIIKCTCTGTYLFDKWQEASYLLSGLYNDLYSSIITPHITFWKTKADTLTTHTDCCKQDQTSRPLLHMFPESSGSSLAAFCRVLDSSCMLSSLSGQSETMLNYWRKHAKTRHEWNRRVLTSWTTDDQLIETVPETMEETSQIEFCGPVASPCAAFDGFRTSFSVSLSACQHHLRLKLCPAPRWCDILQVSLTAKPSRFIKKFFQHSLFCHGRDETGNQENTIPCDMSI